MPRTSPGGEGIEAALAAADPRDREFLSDWIPRSVDPSDPAAPKWIEHCVRRIEASRELVDKVRPYLDPNRCSVLDVGCQTGALGIALCEAGARVTGIDVDRSLLVNGGRRRSQAWRVEQRFAAAVGEALPFRSGSFDLVTFVDVIEHVSDADRCLRELVRVLKIGGVLVVQGPNRFSPEWFFRDPHYGLVGASILPPALGRRYAEWWRGRQGYDVGTFPRGHHVVSVLTSLGCRCVVLDGRLFSSILRRFSRSGVEGLLARGVRHVQLAVGSIFTVIATRET